MNVHDRVHGNVSVRTALRAILASACLVACPSPHQPPNPDASDAALLGDAPATCSAACSNLAALQCREGTDAHCLTFCTKNAALPITALPLACWASATSKEAARACGQLDCP